MRVGFLIVISILSVLIVLSLLYAWSLYRQLSSCKTSANPNCPVYLCGNPNTSACRDDKCNCYPSRVVNGKKYCMFAPDTPI